MSVAFVREESAENAPEIALPERPISAHPNLVTLSGLKALESAAAESGVALKTAQGIEDANERRRALGLAARDARYFSERLANAILRPEPESVESVAFGHRVTSYATASAARLIGLSARTRPTRAPERSPMWHRSRAASSASASARSWTWTAARSRSSKSHEAAERHRGETDGAPLSRRA